MNIITITEELYVIKEKQITFHYTRVAECCLIPRIDIFLGCPDKLTEQLERLARLMTKKCAR